MVLRFILPLFFLALAPSHARAALFGGKALESITSSSPHAALARSTAVAVLSSNFSEAGPGKISLNVDSFEKYFCAGEPFAKDPSLSYACSGFLVGPDLIATAGHCMVNTGESRNETETYCEAFSWLFGYEAGIDLQNVPAEDHYRCKQVVYAIREEGMPLRDFALVQLDRPVTGRAALPLSLAPLSAFERFSMIGYPLGTPAKASFNAKLLLNDLTRESFITNLDAFEGNSGSAVFNAKNEVVGILIGGSPIDYSYYDASRGCYRVNRCDENGEHCNSPDTRTNEIPGYQRAGSEVQRIAPLADLLRSFNK